MPGGGRFLLLTLRPTCQFPASQKVLLKSSYTILSIRYCYSHLSLNFPWRNHSERLSYPLQKNPKTYNNYDDQVGFSIFFSSKKQCKALHWGLAEGEITFFTAAHMTLCCVFVPQTALISQQCFTYCWPTHSIHQIHRWFTRLTAQRLPLLLILPLQEAGRRWTGVWEKTQMENWPTKRYSRPCNITLGNKTAGCFFQINCYLMSIWVLGCQ